MKSVITVEQLIDAVELVRAEQRDVQRTLEQLLQVLRSANTRAEIAVDGIIINPGRVGKVCSVICGPSKARKAD